VLDDGIEAEQRCEVAAIRKQMAAIHTPRAARAAVDSVKSSFQAFAIPKRRRDETQKIMTERRGLRLLKIGLVRHEGLTVPLGDRAGRPGKRGRRFEQLRRQPA